MKRSGQGFTIVELLIVIIGLGIIMAIAIPMWFTAAQTSRDKARETDARNWSSTFELYKARFGTYPVLPTNDTTPVYACLGLFSSTSSRCGQYNSTNSTQYLVTNDSTDAHSQATTTILAGATRTGSVPSNSGPVINNSYSGPFLWEKQVTSGTTVTVTAEYINFFEGNCPSDFTNETANADTVLHSIFTNIGTAKACGLIKTTVNSSS